jgi:HD superfamily phosphohydrolase YqeK
MGCLDWCQHAEDCVGTDVYTKFLKNKTTGMKRKLLDQMTEYFQGDEKRINHSKAVLELAEEILKGEDADWHIVIPASILHDIGIKRAEKKYGSVSAHYQEKEGPPVAEKMLLGLGLKKEDVQEICAIIRYHHTPGKVPTSNLNVVYDADGLANLRNGSSEPEKGSGNAGIKNWIERKFLTESARKIAYKIYSKIDTEV